MLLDNLAAEPKARRSLPSRRRGSEPAYSNVEERRLRLSSLYLVVLLAAAFLIYRLYEVQVAEGEMHTANLRNQTTMKVVLSPARGSILDRNGQALAENKASLDIDIYLRELVGYYKLSQGGRQPLDIYKIVNESSAEIRQTLGLKDIDEKALRRHYNQQPNIPFQLANNLDFTKLSLFSEHSLNIRGIQETARPIRAYPFGALASQILGYVGKVEEKTDAEYIPEFVGKEGIEKSFDSYLQGKPGFRVLRKNNQGHVLSVESETPPAVGDSVYLTIDARIQYITEEAMRKVGRGAAVVMDPRNGDVLAMVSVPSFDPNDFVPAINPQLWKSLTKDPTKPLLNRVINAYAPGSVFKPVTAIGGFISPKTDFKPNKTYYTPASVSLGGITWEDWYKGSRGDINLKTALEWSCNPFFYKLAERAGIESIDEAADRVGLGHRLLEFEPGISYIRGESAGVIPGPKWMDDIGRARLKRWQAEVAKARAEGVPKDKLPRQPVIESWSLGHTYNVSIGQGNVLITPLQLVTVYSAIANGGTVYFPRLVLGVTRNNDGERETIREYEPRIHGQIGIEADEIKGIQDGLRAVVATGTAKKAALPDIEVAGKTGTAQFWRNGIKDNRTWFVGYAPFRDPRYVVAVMIEGGTSGGGTSAPVVNEIMRGIFAMEKGVTPELSSLKPAVGSFNAITGEDNSDPSAPSAGTPPPAADEVAPAADPEPVEAPKPEKKKGPSLFDKIFNRRNR